MSSHGRNVVLTFIFCDVFCNAKISKILELWLYELEINLWNWSGSWLQSPVSKLSAKILYYPLIFWDSSLYNCAPLDLEVLFDIFHSMWYQDYIYEKYI